MSRWSPLTETLLAPLGRWPEPAGLTLSDPSPLRWIREVYGGAAWWVGAGRTRSEQLRHPNHSGVRGLETRLVEAPQRVGGASVHIAGRGGGGCGRPSSCLPATKRPRRDGGSTEMARQA